MVEGDFALQLLEAARRDPTAWRKLVHDVEIHDSTLGFHAQQVDLLSDAGLVAPPECTELDRLNSYAVEARYGYPLAGPLDRDTVGARIEAVIVWAGRVVGAGGMPG